MRKWHEEGDRLAGRGASNDQGEKRAALREDRQVTGRATPLKLEQGLQCDGAEVAKGVDSALMGSNRC